MSRHEPTDELVALLDRLRLATPGQVASARDRVARLAGELPLFETVWVDALAQARILTAFQAAQINAGRGDSLRLGDYLLSRPLAATGYAECYAGRHLETGRLVRLLLTRIPGEQSDAIAARLQSLVEQSRLAGARQIATVEEFGVDGDRVWAASALVEGRAAAEWMVENGRFPPQVVLHVAREVLAGLAALEQFDLLHGDLHTAGLLLQTNGQVVLTHPGVRGIVRPAEGFAHNDLRPEAYDYLSPERVADGAPPATPSEMFACGCVWWHLLTGRAPFAGGNTMAKLRAVHAGRIADVRRLAPDTPDTLAQAIDRCLAFEPSARPDSFARLAETLGPPTRQGQRALARCLREPSPAGGSMTWRTRSGKKRSRGPGVLAGAALGAVAVAGLTWPMWHARNPSQATKNSAGTTVSWNQPIHGAADRGDQVALSAGEQNRDETSGRVVDRDEVSASKQSSGRQAPAAPRPLYLPAGRTLNLEKLEPLAGQKVCGEAGQRPQIHVPGDGLVIASEGVCFENIDFVWQPIATEENALRPAMIVLATRQAEFRGCTFQAAEGSAARPVAIVVLGAEASRVDPALPGCELSIGGCWFRGVAAAIDCRARGSVSIDIVNTLHVTAGPLVRLDHCPRQTESAQIALEHATLRDAGPVLECDCDAVEPSPGRIKIAADDSAFVPSPGESLLVFAGPEPPDRALRAIEWHGTGSLLATTATIAAWRGPGGKVRQLADELVDIAGLVRSEVEFAGEASGSAAASRITRWQGPGRSTRPPGIGQGLLFSP